MIIDDLTVVANYVLDLSGNEEISLMSAELEKLSNLFRPEEAAFNAVIGRREPVFIALEKLEILAQVVPDQIPESNVFFVVTQVQGRLELLVGLEESVDDGVDIVIDTSGHEPLPLLMIDVCVVNAYGATRVCDLPS